VDIINKPLFKRPIRSQRCLVIADAFYEGPEKEKLSKPYLVYLKNNVWPFTFAGIWDRWQSEEGEITYSFAIITTGANALLKKVEHHRSPVTLKQDYEAAWLNNKLPLDEVTILLQAYPAELMNAYPASPEIKNPKAEGKQLLEAVGERLASE
jgi:putative SOS response-associated peptidase YedK